MKDSTSPIVSIDRSLEAILENLENAEYDSEPELSWYDSGYEIAEALKSCGN